MILGSQIHSLGSGAQTRTITIRTELDNEVCTHNPEWRGLFVSVLGTLWTEGDYELSSVTTMSDRNEKKERTGESDVPSAARTHW